MVIIQNKNDYTPTINRKKEIMVQLVQSNLKKHYSPVFIYIFWMYLNIVFDISTQVCLLFLRVSKPARPTIGPHRLRVMRDGLKRINRMNYWTCFTLFTSKLQASPPRIVIPSLNVESKIPLNARDKRLI